jgi:hypothetical protein
VVSAFALLFASFPAWAGVISFPKRIPKKHSLNILAGKGMAALSGGLAFSHILAFWGNKTLSTRLYCPDAMFCLLAALNAIYKPS